MENLQNEAADKEKYPTIEDHIFEHELGRNLNDCKKVLTTKNNYHNKYGIKGKVQCFCHDKYKVQVISGRLQSDSEKMCVEFKSFNDEDLCQSEPF